MENKAYMNVKMALLSPAPGQERRLTPPLALTSCRDGMGSDLRRGSGETLTRDWGFQFLTGKRREGSALKVNEASVW